MYLLDGRFARPLQVSGVLLLLLALFVLTPFFSDLFVSLALRMPLDVLRDIVPVLSGIGMAILIPVVGATLGALKGSKNWVLMLMILLGIAIGGARYSKTIEKLEAQAKAAKKDEAESDANKAKAALLRAAGDALVEGSKGRGKPQARKDAQRMVSLLLGKNSENESAQITKRDQGPSTMKVLELVVGPAATEFIVAELVLILASAWGQAAFLPMPVVTRREEGETESGASTVVHAGLRNVDLASLPSEVTEGLDTMRGTWHGMILDQPRIRRKFGKMWPVLAQKTESGKTIFAGTTPAFRAAGVSRARRTGGPEQAQGWAPHSATTSSVATEEDVA